LTLSRFLGSILVSVILAAVLTGISHCFTALGLSSICLTIALGSILVVHGFLATQVSLTVVLGLMVAFGDIGFVCTLPDGDTGVA
jgi:hypothetical protein